MDRSLTDNRRTAALLVGLLLLIVAMTMALLLSAGNGKAEPDRYVALGDSFSAGMGIAPVSSRTVPRPCLQSERSYPYLVQEKSDFGSFESATCSGAVIPDFSASQSLEYGQGNEPQYERLNGDESFVTFGIGGNDVGFWGIVLQCFSNDDPHATPCRDRYLRDGKDTLREKADALEPALENVVDEIRERSPNAVVYLVGYAQIVNPRGAHCQTSMRVSPADAAYFDGFQRYLNERMRDAAEASGIRFIDIYERSVGHDACKPPDVRWVEPRVGSRLMPNVQVHPNEAGERAVANLILEAMQADGIGDLRR